MYDYSQHTMQDPIHGGIPFGSIEKTIIDHGLFQRLRNLRQNSLLHLVFPSANHTRFEHSIGVMHLASRFLDSIVANQLRICERSIYRKELSSKYLVDTPEVEQTMEQLSHDEYAKLVLRVAALLHDSGHGPFSHLFDDFFPSTAFIKTLSGSLPFDHVLRSLAGDNQDKPVKHELLSCLIATKIISDRKNELSELPGDPLGFAIDVCSVIDEKISASKQLEKYPFRIKSLLHDIVAGTVDADRMDYLLRDSHMCGVNYGLYDPDRILKSICAYAEKNTSHLHVAIRYSGLGALEDMLLSRYQMFSQIYGHKTNRACAVILDEIKAELKVRKWSVFEACDSIDKLLGTLGALDDSAFILKLRKVRHNSVNELLGCLKDRNLRKRVYEGIHVVSSSTSNEKLELQDKSIGYRLRLKKNGIAFREDFFENKGPSVAKNYALKVLQKTGHGSYVVHNLVDYSTVARRLPETELTYRIYCDKKNAKKAKELLEAV